MFDPFTALALIVLLGLAPIVSHHLSSSPLWEEVPREIRWKWYRFKSWSGLCPTAPRRSISPSS
jgi:hypothetical protein